MSKAQLGIATGKGRVSPSESDEQMVPLSILEHSSHKGNSNVRQKLIQLMNAPSASLNNATSMLASFEQKTGNRGGRPSIQSQFQTEQQRSMFGKNQ